MNQTQSAFQLLESIIPDECPELTDTLLQLSDCIRLGHNLSLPLSVTTTSARVRCSMP